MFSSRIRMCRLCSLHRCRRSVLVLLFGPSSICLRLHEFVEQESRVIGPWRALRVPLDPKDSAVAMPDAFDRLIVSVQVTRLKPCLVQGSRPDCVAVVLSSDETSSSLEI